MLRFTAGTFSGTRVMILKKIRISLKFFNFVFSSFEQMISWMKMKLKMKIISFVYLFEYFQKFWKQFSSIWAEVFVRVKSRRKIATSIILHLLTVIESDKIEYLTLSRCHTKAQQHHLYDTRTTHRSWSRKLKESDVQTTAAIKIYHKGNISKDW